MKTAILAALLALSLAAPLWADEPKPLTIDDLNRTVQELTVQLKTSTQDVADLQKRLDTIEKRLGESYRGVSSFNTVERRLDDLQKDVDDLKRRR
jgi:predicted  nucleic acid-binding Zn-ribbon protein